LYQIGRRITISCGAGALTSPKTFNVKPVQVRLSMFIVDAVAMNSWILEIGDALIRNKVAEEDPEILYTPQERFGFFLLRFTRPVWGQPYQ
jgi:hypothetical protein